MQQEALLLALGPADRPSSDLYFAHAAEREMLARFAVIGKCCEQLRQHIALFQEGSPYILAAEMELQDVYQRFVSRLAAVETECLSHADPTPLPLLLSQLDPEAELVRYAVEICTEVTTKKLDGGRLLGYLYTADGNCVDHRRSALLRSMLIRCHTLLYWYFQEWLAAGALPASPHSFWIHATEKGTVIIDADELPIYMPGALAEKILFIGNAERMLKTAGRPSPPPDWSQLQQALTPASGAFQVSAFESVVERLRQRTGCMVWEELWERSGLPGHLATIYSFLLAARGDFYATWLEAAAVLFTAAPGPNFLHEASVLFQQSASRTSALLDERFSLLSLRLRDGTGNWQGLYLEYQVAPPLDFFLTPEVMARYSALFPQFLHVRLRQQQLHQAWSNLKLVAKTGRRVQRLFLLRARASYFVDTVAHYLQAELVEASFSRFVEVARTTKDFDRAVEAHTAFLATVEAQGFSGKRLAPALDDVLMAAAAVAHEAATAKEDSERVDALAKDWERTHGLLCTLLSRVTQSWSGALLERLGSPVLFQGAM